jgi:hypothetical protein
MGTSVSSEVWHDTLQDGLGDELVPIDPAIDDEAAHADRRVLSGLGELLGHERDLQAAGRREEIDATLVVAVLRELGGERLLAAVGDVGVPRGLNIGDLLVGSHEFLSCVGHDVTGSLANGGLSAIAPILPDRRGQVKAEGSVYTVTPGRPSYGQQEDPMIDSAFNGGYTAV